REIDWPYLHRMQRRLERLVPAARGLGWRKAWCATIDFTPDHQPILGPAITPSGERIEGVTIPSPGGQGMMGGPAVARVDADLVVHGRTELIDVTELGLDRFDAEGRSRLAAAPIALPFPLRADDDCRSAPPSRGRARLESVTCRSPTESGLTPNEPLVHDI